MAGKTVEQIAKELGRIPVSIHKNINECEKVEPDYVARYRKIARTHQFGYYRKHAQDKSCSEDGDEFKRNSDE